VIKGCGKMREGVAEQKIFRDGKICGGARRRLIRRRRVPNGCTRSVLRPEISRRGVGVPGWGMGRDSESSAQSKRGGAGIKHGGIGLGGCETGDGGRKTMVAGGSDMSAVVEGAGGGETARLQLSWGELSGWDTFRGWSDVFGRL
jgi:hypothetical protein